MDEKESQPETFPHKNPLEQSSSPAGGRRRTWPEVVGLTAEEAERKIKEEMPAGTRVDVVQPDWFVTMDYRTDRVRIFIDSTGKVHKPPMIG
ncbi:hypothetical protein ACP275_10G032600 [Erythranthe tilingii]